MKNKTLKKIISILLAAVTVLSLPFGALAAQLNAAPVIYIGEMSDNPFYINPNKNGSSVVFDINSSDFTGDIASIVAGVALTSFTGEAASGVTPVVNGIKGMMDPILCDSNGEPTDSKVGVWEYSEPISAYKADSVYSPNIQALASSAAGYVSEDEIFFFSYDWRTDPLASAEKLYEFIEHVEKTTGSNKVSLLGVGYGGVIINSYLFAYEEHAKSNIASTVFYNCPILGNAIIGDFMKGRIARIVADEDSLTGIIGTINGTHRGEAFFNFIEDDTLGMIDGIFKNLLGDSEITTLFGKLFVMLITTIVEGEDGHKMLGKAYNNFALNVDNTIYDDFLREYLRNMPGLWALVPEKDYDEAVSFMFGDEIVSQELLYKIDDYREVLSSTDETLKTAQANGINVCIVAGYGFQLLPATISLDDMSDSIESVKYASAGAVTTDNAKETDHYVNCIYPDRHNHLSPDKDIDASYCILPESTWFIKGVPHGDLTNKTVADFVSWLVFGFNQRNVRENAEYTQFMKYSVYTKKLAPYTTPGVDEPSQLLGDIDYSAGVDATDARLALRIAVGLDTVNKETRIVADVDYDGKVTSNDARLILRYAVGLTHSF